MSIHILLMHNLGVAVVHSPLTTVRIVSLLVHVKSSSGETVSTVEADLLHTELWHSVHPLEAHTTAVHCAVDQELLLLTSVRL